MKRLIVLDANAPWVRSLFLAMPNEIEIRILHVGHPRVIQQLSGKSWVNARRWTTCGVNALERWITIPGWNKAPAVSTWLTSRAVASAATSDRSDTGVVLALPQFAGVAEKTVLRPRIYYAHDPFEYYDWDRDLTRSLETRMLKATEMTFAISHLLRDDLAARTLRPIYYSPNAVSADFVEKLQRCDVAIPSEMASISRPIVGCTGQINMSYDWAMLAELAAVMPDISFVFIGPIAVEGEQARRVIDGVLKNRANVHWLGPKPHADLPAYLRAFDVCLNPLTPGAHADRRSPLRLYDYVATGKPVVSTNIAETDAHETLVWVGRNAGEIEQHIRAAITGSKVVDAKARQEYVNRNTWQARALNFLKQIGQVF